jgi:hypothetical protein
MEKVKTIQVDGRFPDFRAEKLAEYLQDGWIIMDKTIIKERYINYILFKTNDPDLGKTGDMVTP